MSDFNLGRCIRASKHIYMRGFADTTDRLKILERVIASINRDGDAALAREYVGMKNYAGFGDQEVSCEYGMGPTYGSVVFEIGRANGARGENSVTLGADEIYYLECLRDFKGLEMYDDVSKKKRLFNLDNLIRKHVENQKNLAETTAAFEGFTPDIQAPDLSSEPLTEAQASQKVSGGKEE